METPRGRPRPGRDAAGDRRRARSPRAGAPRGWTTGRAPGHFGEFLQGRLGPSGPVVLVTLPCPALGAEAAFRPGGPFALHAGAASPLPPLRAARLAAVLLGAAQGRLRLRARAPAGGGAGASTAALLAAARAMLAAAARAEPPPERLEALLLRLEGAVDPLARAAPAALLWAPREARALAGLPPPPSFTVVGGFAGPGLRTDPADRRFPDIADLLADWAPAAAAGDRARLAALATASTRRTRALRGGRDLAALEALAAETGALGLVSAHTGSARGLLFAPGAGDPGAAAAGLRALGLSRILRFETS